MLEVVSGDNCSYSGKSCKAPVKSSPPTNQHPVFTDWMPFLSPSQQCQSTEGNVTYVNPLTTVQILQLVKKVKFVDTQTLTY